MCTIATQSIGLGKSRIEALTDGVFATLMTVLVLTLALPSGPGSLIERLWSLRYNILTYAMSFIVLGVFWVGHHNQFHYIRGSNRVFLWLNVLFMMSVGLLPFSTSVLGSNFLRRSAVIIYGLNLILAGSATYLIWWYATRNHKLVDPDLDSHLVRAVKNRILTGPAIDIIAIGFSFLLPVVSVILYFSTMVYFILPGHIDIHFGKTHH